MEPLIDCDRFIKIEEDYVAKEKDLCDRIENIKYLSIEGVEQLKNYITLTVELMEIILDRCKQRTQEPLFWKEKFLPFYQYLILYQQNEVRVTRHRKIISNFTKIVDKVEKLQENLFTENYKKHCLIIYQQYLDLIQRNEDTWQEHSKELDSTVNNLHNESITKQTLFQKQGPAVKEKLWTLDVVDELNKLKEKNQYLNYRDIADILSQKFNKEFTQQQVQERWTRVQQPQLVKGRFTAKEDKLLLKLYKENNGNVKDIHEQFQTRSLLQIQRRLAILLKYH